MRTLISSIVVFLVIFSNASSYSGETSPQFELVFGGGFQITEADILKYIWESHTIILTYEAINKFEHRWPMPESRWTSPGGFGIKLNGKTEYSGKFSHHWDSTIPTGPYICWPINETGWVGIRISNRGFEDLRFSERVKQALIEQGVFQEAEGTQVPEN